MCASQLSRWVKNPPAMQETHVWSLGCDDPLEEGMATHSSILFFFNINLFVLFGGLLLYNIVLVLPYINMNGYRMLGAYILFKFHMLFVLSVFSSLVLLEVYQLSYFFQRNNVWFCWSPSLYIVFCFTYFWPF